MAGIVTGCFPGNSEIALRGLLFLSPPWAHPKTDGPPLDCSQTSEQRYSFRSSWPREHFESDARKNRWLTLILGAVGGRLWEAISSKTVFSLTSSGCDTLHSLLF